MTRDIIGFEWRYHSRQISFIGACLLFLIFGFALSATGFGPDNIAVNSPFIIMESIGLLSLLSVFVLAVFSANAIVRDREYRMEEIVFSTAVEKRHFLGGRFAGSFLAAFTAFSVCVAGMLLGTFLISHDPSRMAPLQLGHYLWALLVLALPNLLLAAVLLFGIAALTRSLLASSVGAVLIYVLYFAVSAWTNSPLMASSVPGGQNSWFVSLFDPFGLSAFFEQTRYWTAAERNSRLTSLSGVFLANRLLWLGIGAAGWGVVHRLFKFTLLNERRARVDKTASAPVDALPYAAVEPSESYFAAFLSTTRLEVRSYLKTLPFLALTLLWAALALSEIASDVGSGEYGSVNYATTGLVLGAMQQSLQLIALVVLTYFSAEMLWRERTLRVNGILNVTPTPSATFVLAKWAALAMLTAVLIVVGVVVGVLYQLAHGVPSIDWTLIAKFAWFNGAPLVLFAIVAVLVHTVSPHKYLGMMIVLLLAALMRQATLAGALHHLWAFGSAPPVVWTDMNGFGPTAAPFNWYMLHWALVGALLLTLAAALWRRSRAAFKPLRVRIVLGALSIAAVASGAHIAFNTLVLNDWESPAERRAWRGDYEKTYGRFASLPQPRVVAIESRVDLFPDERRFGVHGSYVLRNDTTASIDRLLVSVAPDAQRAALSMPGAKVTAADSRFGHYWLQLAQPLAPGATTRLSFDVAFGSRGFSDQGSDTSVVANGSFLPGARVFPAIGYRKRYELVDPADRRKEALPAKGVEPEGSEEGDSEVVDWVTTDLTVSTAPEQIAVTSGRLARQWTDGGRRYFRYVSDGPIPNGLTFASARYSVARGAYRDIPIEIDYHPAHAFNVPRMMETASASLQYFEQSFGPYPHRQLKIVEASPSGFSGQARPDTIFIGERRGFLIDVRDRGALDLVARRVSHEIAHQWWGGALTPANHPGATVLTESLTKYAELLVLERMQGRDALRRSLTYELDLYLSGRSDARGSEKPLSRAAGESYLYYRKGALVMNAIEDLLGEAALNRALRAFMADQGGPGHSPTITQLLDRLRAEATPAQQTLIDEWMNKVVLYDLSVASARSRPLGDGRFEVRIDIRAKKETALHEDLEIALFERHPDRTDAKDNVIYAGKHAIHDGANTISVIVTRQPGVAAIDPYVLRIDHDRFDNFKDVAK
jgi:ABC-type transport system involved in multi-copper enzyme maturation permease subunit